MSISVVVEGALSHDAHDLQGTQIGASRIVGDILHGRVEKPGPWCKLRKGALVAVPLDLIKFHCFPLKSIAQRPNGFAEVPQETDSARLLAFLPPAFRAIGRPIALDAVEADTAHWRLMEGTASEYSVAWMPVLPVENAGGEVSHLHMWVVSAEAVCSGGCSQPDYADVVDLCEFPAGEEPALARELALLAVEHQLSSLIDAMNSEFFYIDEVIAEHSYAPERSTASMQRIRDQLLRDIEFYRMGFNAAGTPIKAPFGRSQEEQGRVLADQVVRIDREFSRLGLSPALYEPFRAEAVTLKKINPEQAMADVDEQSVLLRYDGKLLGRFAQETEQDIRLWIGKACEMYYGQRPLPDGSLLKSHYQMDEDDFCAPKI